MYRLLIILALFFAYSWVHTNFFIKIDTKEVDRYYDLLLKNAGSSKDIVLDLDTSEDSDLQMIADRLKKAMGLGKYRIWVGYYDGEKPPAFIKTVAPGAMTIVLSRKIKQKREQINVLIHELGHIYVWAIDKSLLKDCDEEKVVDCAGVFLGMGVLMLNGLTDDVSVMPDGEYHSEKKMFGYLKPEQLGYLFARYCEENKISSDKIVSHLGPAGRKYFNIGHNYLMRARGDRKSDKIIGTALSFMKGWFRKTRDALGKIIGALSR